MNQYYETPIPSNQFRSDGSVAKPADGINSDGSQRIQIVGTMVVEIFSGSNIAVGPAGNVTIVDNIDLSKYRHIVAAVILDANQDSSTFDIKYVPKDSTSKEYGGSPGVLSSVPTASKSFWGSRIDVRSTLGRIFAQNNGAQSRTIQSLVITGFTS
ncbi:hypothetical protein [Paenibacillus sp. P22]|uniref:hypothetical protein n=1 Tax=Paenibacillus sp. P22 TaxID=483908 RepID=UPI00038F2B05|nr:hypothetical protein [Paenibacillus sp. P22]CDN41441.1 hypothetical protein BN871_AH_00150 [Paenibacillus sp. P22]